MNVNKAGLTHDQLQRDCFVKGSRLYHPFLHKRLFSVPNDMAGGNAARARHYQAIGVTAGVWDMQLCWFEMLKTEHSTIYPIPAVHWFEFKVGRDTLKDPQKEFRDIMLPLGHKFYIISETETFLEQLKLIVEPTLHIAKQIWNEGEGK